jgi:hypothetical protein
MADPGVTSGAFAPGAFAPGAFAPCAFVLSRSILFLIALAVLLRAFFVTPLPLLAPVLDNFETSLAHNSFLSLSHFE